MWPVFIVLSNYRVFEEINPWDQGLSMQMEVLKESQFYKQPTAAS